MRTGTGGSVNPSPAVIAQPGWHFHRRWYGAAVPAALVLQPPACALQVFSLGLASHCPESETDPGRKQPPSARPGRLPLGEPPLLRVPPPGCALPAEPFPGATLTPLGTMSHPSQLNSGVNAPLTSRVFPVSVACSDSVTGGNSGLKRCLGNVGELALCN